MKVGLQLVKNVLTSLSKSVLITLDLTAATSTADGQNYKKILGPRIYGSVTATPIISSKEMEDIMKVVMSLEGSRLLIKDVTQTIENKTRE